MIKIKRLGKFDRMLDDLAEENFEIIETVREKIKFFENNPEDTRLDNHALTEKMAGKWAFSITSETRIVYEWVGKTTVRFLAIGGHEKVYKQ